MPPDASGFLTAGFVVFTGALGLAICALVYAAGRALREGPNHRLRWTAATAVGIGLWMLVTWLVADTGLIAEFDRRPPPMLLMFGVVLAVSATLAFSRFGTRLVHGLPMWALVLSQAFRLPLELLMHRAAEEGVMPLQMSYSGRNLDIVTGITALVVAWLLARGTGNRLLTLGWNILGLVLLANILGIAILSTPIFAAFGPDHLNTWVAYPPFIWLPTVMVLWALTGHLLIFRKLFSRSG